MRISLLTRCVYVTPSLDTLSIDDIEQGDATIIASHPNRLPGGSLRSRDPLELVKKSRTVLCGAYPKDLSASHRAPEGDYRWSK